MLLIIPIRLNTLLILRTLRVNLAMPNPNLKSVIMSGMLTNVRIYSNLNRELFKVNEVLKTQPPTYKIKDIFGEIVEAKYYEQ